MKYNFIILYRNRKEHLDEFIRRFTEFTKDIDAQFYIVHQFYAGDFNRGALCNIGFMEFCKSRPDGLFIFHDVDTYPTYWGSIQYNTKLGEIRHPIGSKEFRNLGCISCFWKPEFEKVNGFPNYWGWGIEDITIMYRAINLKIYIDEENIVDLKDKKRCHNPVHYRSPENYEKARINTELHHKEMESGQIVNGLSNLEYTVLSTFELAPRFTIINVDFKLKD